MSDITMHTRLLARVLLMLVICMSGTGTVIAADATFIGTQQCRNCHQAEYKAWSGSHHAAAMAHADESSVLGDFDNSKYR